MNKVILMGRLTREPEMRYSQGAEPLAIARYTIAVNRRVARSGGTEEQTADFINCVAFGRAGEFAEKYLHKGVKIAITGRIQTGSYTNKDGIRVFTTEVVVEEQEFAESKNSASGASGNTANAPAARGVDPYSMNGGFMNIPDGLDEELPFN